MRRWTVITIIILIVGFAVYKIVRKYYFKPVPEIKQTIAKPKIGDSIDIFNNVIVYYNGSISRTRSNPASEYLSCEC